MTGPLKEGATRVSSQGNISIQEGVTSMSIIYVPLNGLQKMALKRVGLPPCADNIIQIIRVSVISKSTPKVIPNDLVILFSPPKKIIEKKQINTKIVADTPESQQERTLTESLFMILIKWERNVSRGRSEM